MPVCTGYSRPVQELAVPDGTAEWIWQDEDDHVWQDAVDADWQGDGSLPATPLPPEQLILLEDASTLVTEDDMVPFELETG